MDIGICIGMEEHGADTYAGGEINSQGINACLSHTAVGIIALAATV